jgi:UDP-N-acetylmuramoyl-tripeptide--D-alanyl-D-alanine ligase
MVDILWTRDDFIAACKGEAVGTVNDVTGISIDSRTIAKNEAFFAIKGDRFDGHDFVETALQNGAGVCVVSQKWFDQHGDAIQGGLIVVDDVLEALRSLAKAARARSKAKIVAVTGSVGKTGTKEALRLVLSQFGETHASKASFNNHWGVPLSLARLPLSAEFAIFEIGMNHANEITPLVQMVQPHAAIITTVAAVHLEHFDNVECIAEAKAEIFHGFENRSSDSPLTAIVNADIEFTPLLIERARSRGADKVLTFGEADGADIRVLSSAILPDCSTVDATVDDIRVTYKIGAPGKHYVMNSLSVLAVAHVFDLDLARAVLSLSKLQPPAGRGLRIEIDTEGEPIRLIDESYNANPASMRAAFSVLSGLQPNGRGRRIAVLGDMLELGETSEQLHAELAKSLEDNAIDRVFCCGPLMQSLWRVLPPQKRGAYAPSSRELVGSLIQDLTPGDVIMIKGSLGSRMAVLVEAVQNAYTSKKTSIPA